jgi:hypothetical protein
MSPASGVRTVCVIALVCAIAGGAAMPASTSRHAARQRVGKVIESARIPVHSSRARARTRKKRCRGYPTPSDAIGVSGPGGGGRRGRASL